MRLMARRSSGAMPEEKADDSTPRRLRMILAYQYIEQFRIATQCRLLMSHGRMIIRTPFTVALLNSNVNHGDTEISRNQTTTLGISCLRSLEVGTLERAGPNHIPLDLTVIVVEPGTRIGKLGIVVAGDDQVSGRGDLGKPDALLDSTARGLGTP